MVEISHTMYTTEHRSRSGNAAAGCERIFLLVLGLSAVAIIVLCVEICVFKKRRNMYRDN